MEALSRSCAKTVDDPTAAVSNWAVHEMTKTKIVILASATQSSFCSEPCKWGSDSEQQCSGGGGEEEEEEDCHSWVWLRGDSKGEDEKTKKKKIVIPASATQHDQCEEAHWDGEEAAEAGCHGES